MNIQAEVSLYALRTKRTGPAIGRFLRLLGQQGVEVAPGAMSSYLRGEAGAVFSALANAFIEVAQDEQTVVVVKASNACPLETTTDEVRESDLGKHADG